VRCRQIRVGQALGIRQGDGFLVDELSPGITLILAPNGTGKTTLARTLVLLALGGGKDAWRQLLREGAAADASYRRLDLKATFEVPARAENGKPLDWEISVFGGEVDEHIDGHEHRSSSPDLVLASRYLISLPDLFVDEGGGFGQQILEQASGGVPWAELRESLGWAEPPGRPQGLLKECKAARDNLKEATKVQSDLERLVQDLPGLRAKRDALRERRRRYQKLQRAQIGRNLSLKLKEQQCRLDEFGDIVRGLTGLKRATADQKRSDALSASKELESRVGELDDVRSMAPPALSEGERKARIDIIEGHVKCLEVRQSELRKAEKEHLAAVAVLQETGSRLSALSSAMPKSEPGEVPVDRILNSGTLVSRAAWDWSAKHAAAEDLRQNVDRLKDRFGSVHGMASCSADDVSEALRLLASWLRQQRTTETAASGSIPIALIVALTLVCTALAASLRDALAGSWLAIASAAFSAAAIMLVLFWRFGRGAARPPEHERAIDANRTDYERLASGATGLPAISEWTFDSVSGAHKWLAKAAVSIEMSLLLRDAESALRDSKDALATAEKRLKAAELELEQLVGPGIVGHDAVWASLIASLCADWLQAKQRAAESDAVLKSARQDVEFASAAAEEALVEAGCCDARGVGTFSAEMARSLVDDLRKRMNANESYEQNQLKPAQGRVDKAQLQCRAAQAAFLTFLKDLPGGPFAEDALPQMLDDVDKYREVKLEFDRREVALRAHLAEGIEPDDIKSMSDVQIADEIAALPELEDQIDDLEREIAERNQMKANAEAGNSMSNALAELAAANLRLRNREISDLDVMIGKAVFAWARREARTAMAPRVLRRAQEIVARITSGRLDFDVVAPDGESDPEFIARNSSEPWRSISELSSGERVQLLLSVRLAFLEEGESMRLPIVLDEVLASSDDERSALVMDTIVDVARSGRQVLYLSSQSDEIEKWAARMQQSGVDCRVVHLAEVRRLASSQARPARRSLPPVRALPSPDGLTREQYGESLGVPGIDWMEEDLDSLHLWYVIPDTHVLHRQLSAGIESLGQLERLARSSESASVRAGYEQSRGRAMGFRAAASAWRIGRGTCVGAEVLDDRTVVSETFRQRVAECLRETGGDARAFLGSVKALKGFRKDVELEAWLVERGYLVDAEPLTSAAARDRVGQALLDAGLPDGEVGAIVDEIMAQLPR
jgi:hypothetical protein